VWIIESDAILQGEVINKPKTKKITIKPKTSEILKTIPRDIEKISQRQTQIILSKLNQKYSEKELADLIEIPDKKDIGVKLASKILTKQKKLGGFKNLSEVYEIEGIGPKRFADIIVSLSQKQT
jgi:ERCC4-type nuclease